MSIQTIGLYCILLSYMLLFRPCYYTFLYISQPNLLHHDAMQPVISFTAPMPPDLKPTVHGRIFRTMTFFVDVVLFDMVHQFHNTFIHALESSIHDSNYSGWNPDRFYRGCRSSMEQSSARNRRRPRIHDHGDTRQARHRQSRMLQATSALARDGSGHGRVRAIYPLLR